MISIITTIYNNNQYIDDALLSFVESCGNIEYEILAGVDNCEKSLIHLLSAYPKLDKKIKIFYFTNKVGTYVIRNTLAKISKYDNLIFFDSDDVMRTNTVPNVLEKLNGGYEFFRFGFIPFNGELKYSKSQNLNLPFSHHFGAFGIKKSVFINLNGFEPWTCAADGEFFWRINANQFKMFNSNDINILYRRHNNNLTSGSETGMNSNLRKEYHKIKDLKISKGLKGPLDKLVTSEYLQLNQYNYNKFYETVTSITNKVLTIIIPTFGNPIFLERTLNSVIDSVKNLKCEILIGIDNCEKTLEFLKNKTFDSRIRFYYFRNNVGPYIVRNSLSIISKSDYILFFDSDDIMTEILIQELLEYKKNHKLIKPMYLDFVDDESNINFDIKKTNTYGEGVFAINKNVFLGMNGFQGWRCAADSELMNRLYKDNIKLVATKQVSFYRRIHPNSLTQHPETGFSSKTRNDYIKSAKLSKGPLKNLTTEIFHEVFFNDNGKPIVDNFIIKKQEINNLLNGVIRLNPNVSKINDKVDYDRINEIINKNVYQPSQSRKEIRQNLPKNRNELIQVKKGGLVETVNKMKPKRPKPNNMTPNVFGGKKRY